MPRHSSSRPRRNPAARKVVLVGAAIVALLVIAGLVISGLSKLGNGGGFCGSRNTVSLTVEPAFEEASRALAADAESNSCTDYDVTAATAAEIRELASAREAMPDLWIPDSAVHLAQVSQEVQVPFETVLNSVASTPVVIAYRDIDVNLESWTTALGTNGLALGDPTESGIADSPILAGTSEVEGLRATSESLGLSLAKLAQGQSSTDESRPSEIELMEKIIATGGAAVVSEQQGLSVLRERPDTGVSLAVPETGAAFLTFPLAVTAQDPGRRGEATEAARALLESATSASFGDKLREGGFRTADRTPLDEDEGVGEVQALVVRNPEQLDAALRRWRLLSLPTRTLVLIDTSGSMASPIESSEKSRMDVLVETASLGLGQFPDEAAVGLWAFGGAVGVPERPYQEIAPLEVLATVTPSGPQRQVIGEALAGLPQLVGGGTDLYRAVLDGYEAAKESYDPNFINAVTVISDGASDNVSTLTREDFLDQLRAKIDPTKPVVVVTIGILDADQATLAEIARATGGSSHIAQSPRDIGKVFAEAIMHRGGN